MRRGAVSKRPPTPMKTAYHALSDVGASARQRDSLFVNPEQNLFVVATGWGPRRREVASKVAVDASTSSSA